MRVLQINSVCGIASTGRIATDIDDVLKKLGHESYIGYGRALPRGCDNAIKIGNKLDTFIHVLETRLFDKHGFGSKNATKKFIRKVDTLGPDVIHLHNLHGYYINIELLFQYLEKENMPVVWTLHDCWAFTGHCSHFDFINCDKWKKGCSICPQKNAYPSSLGVDNSKNNYEQKKKIFTGIKKMSIVTPSLWLAQLVKESFLKDYPVRVISNGIDLNVFKPTKSIFREKYHLNNKFIILGVANVFSEKKGLQRFIDLSKHLRPDEVIVLVGLTEAQRRNLPNNIIGLGRTNSTQKLVEVYSAADVFINLTLEEVFGLVNIEALACGTPVITFNTGGSGESIAEGCGFVVKKDCLDELMKKKEIIKGKGKLYFSQHCINHVTEHFNKKDRYLDYVKMYREMLEQKVEE